MRLHDQRPGLDDPHTGCMPSNPPNMLTPPPLTRIIQTPKILAMLLSSMPAIARFTWMAARCPTIRRLPGMATPWGTGRKTRWLLKRSGFAMTCGWMCAAILTNSAKMTERIGRPDFGTIEIELTVNDPKAYTKPWTVKLDARAVYGDDR